jgi:ABC-type transport system involved in Fe-S cluster assembly fused permease/ATPase subunit
VEDIRTRQQTLRDAYYLFRTVSDPYTTRRLVLALLLVAAAALLSALTPVALKMTVDALTAPAVKSAHVPALIFVSLYVLGQFASKSLTELRMLLHGQAQQRLRRHIGRRLFEHLVKLPLRFHLDRKAGAMGESAEQGIRGYELLLYHAVYTILPVMIEFTLVAIVLIHFGQAKYLLILAGAAIAYLVAFRRGAEVIHEPSLAVSNSHVEAHAILTDSLLNHETVKYFDAEKVVCSRYDGALSRMEAAWRRFFRRIAMNGLLVATVFALSLAASLGFAAYDVTTTAMTVGDFILVNTYVVRLAQPLEMLGSAVRDIAQGVAFLQNLLSLFREKVERDASHADQSQRIGDGALTFDNVRFCYRRQKSVLRNVSFSIPAGRTVAVVGVSGAGKSSLIRLLFRLYEPDAGRILLDGAPIAEMSLSAVRQAIAVVPQDTVLFHDTIAHNIAFGRFGASRGDIEEAARVANLHEFIVSLPEGYETVVGERGLKLSGGERQRVAIARAALKRPRIFVFDEATSSLDSRTEQEILHNLVALASRRTTLVIAHRLSTVVHADEILVLHQGAIVERGTHDELRKLNGQYAALWNAQASGSGRRSVSAVDGASS